MAKKLQVFNVLIVENQRLLVNGIRSKRKREDKSNSFVIGLVLESGNLLTGMVKIILVGRAVGLLMEKDGI
jgi:hypothetical protein